MIRMQLCIMDVFSILFVLFPRFPILKILWDALKPPTSQQMVHLCAFGVPHF